MVRPRVGVEFRRRLASKDPDMMMVCTIFEGISKSAIEKLGLSTNEQRVDSIHIVSKIFARGRIDFFQKTIGHFIISLDQHRFSRLPENIQKWHQRQAEGWFGMGQTQHKQNLEQLSRYLHKLITIFKNDIKRWAKAAMGSSSTLRCLILLILSFIQAIEATLRQLRPSHASVN